MNDTVYEELEQQKRWIPVDDLKRPIGKWADESHWHTRDQIDGKTGYVITGNHDITIIDFDKCIEGSAIVDNADGRYTAAEVEAWLGMFRDCPVYRSSSGRGLHVIVSGSVPNDVKAPLEIYNGHAGRQIVLTGESFNGVTDVLPTKQYQLGTLYRLVRESRPSKNDKHPSPTLNIPKGERHNWRVKQLGILINQGIRDPKVLLAMINAAQSGFDPPACPEATLRDVESAANNFESTYTPTSLPTMQQADMSDVEPINWLWKHRYARGVLHVLSGEGGRGKGLVLLDLAARLATGTQWPDETPLPKPYPVVIMATEDSWNSVIVPRFYAACHLLGKTPELGMFQRIPPYDVNGVSVVSFPSKAHNLEHYLTQIDGTGLLIIEPLEEFYDADINNHLSKDLRRAIAPLNQILEKTGWTGLVLAHHNKRETSNANVKVRGSGALMEVARLAHAVNFASVDDDVDRVWGPTKTNLIPTTVRGLIFNVLDLEWSSVFPNIPDPDGNTIPFIRWCGDCDLTADEIASIQTQRDKGQRKKKLVQCKEALEGLRGKGWREANTVKDMVDASDRTWDKARKEIGVETQTVKEPNGRVKAWEWRVPGE